MTTEDVINVLIKDNSLRYIPNGCDHHYWIYKDYTCFELHFTAYRGMSDGITDSLDECELLEEVYQSKLHIDSLLLREKELKFQSLLTDIKKDFK